MSTTPEGGESKLLAATVYSGNFCRINRAINLRRRVKGPSRIYPAIGVSLHIKLRIARDADFGYYLRVESG